MARRLIVILLLCTIAAGSARADYSLPGVKERLVLLLNLQDVKLDKRGLVFAVNKVERKFRVDKFWMQDRIWSDGICVGVRDCDPQSSASRVREVQLALAGKKDSLLLLELVCVEGTSGFIVTYLKLFDPATEYKRYFPKKTYYDTIKLPFDTRPPDAKGFVEELKKATTKAEARLGDLEAPAESRPISAVP